MLGQFQLFRVSVLRLQSSVICLSSPLLVRRVPVPFLLFSLSACRIRAGKRAGIAHAPAWSVEKSIRAHPCPSVVELLLPAVRKELNHG